MTDGFLKLHRRFFRHWLWSEARTFSRAEAFLDLLQMACFVPTRQLIDGTLIDVPRGGLIASERYLAERWGWTRHKIRTYLQLLVDEGMIRHSNHPKSLITLCNYETWNPSTTANQPDINHASTTAQPNNNKEKKEKNVLSHSPGIATLGDLLAYARSAPVPISEECAMAFHDDMESIGWVRRGMPVRDWRAALRRWASAWNLNLQSRSSTPSHRQQKARREFTEPHHDLPCA